MVSGAALTTRRADWWNVAGLTLLAILPFIPMLMNRRVPVLRDHADYFIPLRWLTARALSSGTVPHWNSLNGLGEPWIANPQTGVMYPPAWLHLLLPFEIAYVLYLALHVAVLGVGTYLVSRRFASPGASTLAAVVSMFCGPVISLMDVSNNLASLAWLPWIVLAGNSGLPAVRRGVAGGIMLALCFLGAEPTFAAVGAVLFVLLTLIRDETIRSRIVVVVVAGVLSILLTGPQLFPFVLSLAGSDRTGGLDPETALANSVGAGDLLRMVNPAIPPGGQRQQFLPSTFMSVCMTLLLALGVSTGLRNLRRWSIVILATAALLMVASAAGSADMLTALMGSLLSAVRHPARYLAVAAVVLCPFIAAGLDRIFEGVSRRWYGLWCAGLLLAVGAAAVTGSTALISLAIVESLCLAVLIRRVPISTKVRSYLLVVLVFAMLLANGMFAFASGTLASLMPAVPDLPAGSRLSVRTTTTQAGVALRQRLPVGYSNLLAGIAKADTPAPVVPARVLRYLAVANEAGVPPLLSMASVSRAQIDRRRPEWREIAALPLVSGWNGAEMASDDEDALARTLRDPDEYALFTADPLLRTTSTDRKPVRVALEPVPNGWRMVVDAPAPVLLMIAERADPGWSATTDGHAADWGVINGVFRAVDVPPGRHTVVWSYITPGWRAGWLAFAGGAALVLLLSSARAQRLLC